MKNIINTIKSNVAFTIASIRTVGLVETAKTNYGFWFRRGLGWGVLAVTVDAVIVIAVVACILGVFGVL